MKTALSASAMILLAGLPTPHVAAAQELGADPGPRLDGWTYRTSARPLSDRYVDPGDRLRDGETGRSSTAIWRGGTVRLDVDLGGPCVVRSVRVHQHRHNLNYKLTHLVLYVRRAGAWDERAREPGFVGPTPSMDFVHTLDADGVTTDSLRLDFVGANVLSLSEIEVFGVREAPGAAAVGAYAGVPFRLGEDPTAREEDLDGDGQVEVVLENAHVRAIFAPAGGGVCRSLRLKPSGAELVYARESGYGLLRDQLWKPDYSFGERVYFHRLENAAGQAGVELWTTGVGGMMSFTEVRKRIVLDRGSPVLRVRLTLSNAPSSQTEYEYGFWSHNWLGQVDARNSYFFPTTGGVKTFTLDADTAAKSGDAWYRHPARGWTAVLSDAGAGLAVELPYKYLSLFYHWHGAGAVAATHEWRLNLLKLKAGERLEAALALVPFEGLSRVDGVVAEVVGEIEAVWDDAGLRYTCRLAAPPGVSGRSAVLRLLPHGEQQGRELGRAAVRPGSVTEVSGQLTGLAPGLYIVRAEVALDGTPQGSFERPVRIRNTTAPYALAPECEQVGRREETTDVEPGREISTAVVTPHVPWARPLPGGRIRALVLMDDLNSREAVELAQRIDLDLDYVKFRTTFAKELLYQGDLGILTLAAARKALLERLRAREYDVFVVAGLKWDFHFTPEIRDLILDKVRAGAGLLLIQPDGFDAETVKELPAAGVAKTGNAGRSMHAWHTWARASQHPLVTGLDWSRFPVTRRHEYDTPPQGEVLATIGEDNAPLLATGTLGEGRVISATWDTLTHVLSYRGYSALTPILSYRGGWLRPEFRSLPQGYHEWWYALLTRLVAWAGSRDPQVSIVSAAPDESARTLRLELSTAQGVAAARVETVWFNADGTQRHTTHSSAGQLRPGPNVVTLPVPPPPAVTVGDNTACFVVRDPGGASLGWGFATVRHSAPVWIGKLQVTPDTLLPRGGVWQEDAPVETRAFLPDGELEVSLGLSAPAPAGLSALIKLNDSRGRAVGVRRAEITPGSSELAVIFEPRLLVRQGLEVVAELVTDGAVFDVRRERVVAYRPRVWDRFWYTSWGGQYLWRSKYLFDFNNRLVRDWGVDVSFWGISELGTGKVRDNAYWGINHSWLGLLSYMGKGVPDFMDKQFSAKAGGYAKTRDKAQLVRTPSLADPAWREGVRASLVDRTRSTRAVGGTYDYCMGDEMSLTHYTRFHDYDWSEHSLAGFRQWLKERYVSPDALNASWGTGFTTWDAVVPLTREEARESDNPAPWFEFRTYMNDQLAGFYAFVQDTIRSVDPHARCGLSGTQSPEAGNGMDWWKLCHAFSYYHSYNTSWSNEMRRSFQRHGGADQSPYFSGYSATDPGAENRMWWCLFHDTRGISAWCTSLFFYGDFSETQSGRDTKAHLRSFRRGIWRLIRGAERQHDGIAIYYSMPTIIAGSLTGEENKINAARDSWVKIIEDCGLQYEFVAYQQIADGILARGEFRVVLLPYTLALSPAEAKALREFVRRGGTLIATRPVGVRDDLGRPQSPGLLDDLFQVGLEGDPVAVEPVVTLTDSVGGLAAGTEIRLPAAVSNLRLQGATQAAAVAGGTAPALASGADGRAVLLNLDFTHYEQERRFHSPTEKQIRSVVLHLLARAGVTPRYPVTLARGVPAQVETVVYRAGGMEFLCLLNAAADRDVASVDLGRRRRVYDVRSETDLGSMATLRIPLEPKFARLYCLADTDVAAPTVTMKDETVARGVESAGTTYGGLATVDVGRASSGPGPQLLRLEVADSKGRERGELMQTVWVNDEAVRTSLPLAPNDPPGAWRITATDVISGQQARATLTVR